VRIVLGGPANAKLIVYRLEHRRISLPFTIRRNPSLRIHRTLGTTRRRQRRIKTLYQTNCLKKTKTGCQFAPTQVFSVTHQEANKGTSLSKNSLIINALVTPLSKIETFSLLRINLHGPLIWTERDQVTRYFQVVSSRSIRRRTNTQQESPEIQRKKM
jgi:hypothetical protein